MNFEFCGSDETTWWSTEIVKDISRTSNDVIPERGSQQKSMREVVGCGGNEDVQIDVRSRVAKLDRIRIDKISGMTEVGGTFRKVGKTGTDIMRREEE